MAVYPMVYNIPIPILLMLVVDYGLLCHSGYSQQTVAIR